MSRSTLIALIVIVLIIAGIVWFVNANDNENSTPVLSVSAFNQTQNKAANEVDAHPQDVVVYTLTAENQTDDAIEGYIMEANISEISDKASLVDASGASYNSATSSLVWTPLDIPAGESITKQFSVRVNMLPSGSTSSAMKLRFNNELSINVSNSTPVVSGNANPPTPRTAPPTGVSGYLPVLFAALSTAAFIAVRKYKFVKV